ncbi:hypothetical protein [Streptomyces violascens]|uniref:Tetratricopeptide repeat protein n=1 Tax=Streptomyces violascens TaxID=67381 RepID=A0ABQ3QWF0_9ACTN|nr:hypothetical protein [Streptomyces violascens]GHI41611.1 hypothetical protein Sviol_60190 [Streptomyces violascens]
MAKAPKAPHIHRRFDWHEREAVTLANLGDAYRTLGETAATLRHHRASLDMSRGPELPAE